MVIDDGSGAEAAAELEQLPRDVQLLRQPHRGVTAAWNLGLQHVATPIVVLLNNDVLIEGAWVERLIEPVRSGTAAISGVERRRERAVPESVLQRVGRNEFIAGWCWAFRTADARAIGGFDPTLWLYFSDTDLQARLLAKRRSFNEIAVIGDLPLRHIGHSSTRLLPGRSAQWRADRTRFIAKWMGHDS
jgi:GT2 family glycosyltransferase